jgi:hypothetical protein
MGATTECQPVESLEPHLNMDFVEPLKVAIDEGIVTKKDGSYFFSHDKIQETSYNITDKQDRCLPHLNIGLALVDLSSGGEIMDIFFRGVTVLDVAGPKALSDENQYSLIVNFNFICHSDV